MGSAGLPNNQARQLGANVSFAQSLSGSQPATPLDLSYVHCRTTRIYLSTIPLSLLAQLFASPTTYPMMALDALKKHRLLKRKGNRRVAASPSPGASPNLPYSAVLKGYLVTIFHFPDHRLLTYSYVIIVETNCAYREFPSLSNNSQLPNANQTSMWSTAGSRNASGPVQRNQPTPVSSQQTGQDELFSTNSSRLPSAQGSFRFGNQGNIQPPSQVPPTTIDEFPPLNRSANGDIGSERGASLMSSLGFGPQSGASATPLQSNRGNGLLNALSANSRANEVRSPPGVGMPSELLWRYCTEHQRT